MRNRAKSLLVVGLVSGALVSAVVFWFALAPRGNPGAPTGASRRATHLSLGPASSCVTTDDGSALCWGTPSFGPREPTTRSTSGVAALAVGYNQGCTTNIDGRLDCWGEDSVVARASLLKDVVELRVAFLNACAREREGSVRCWGRADGHLIGKLAGRRGEAAEAEGPLEVSIARGATQLSSYRETACAVVPRAGGRIVCWGQYPDAPDVGEPAVEVAVGEMFACARLATGVVRCWGKYAYGVMASDPGVSDAVGIAAGHERACTITRDGSVSCWGAKAAHAQRALGLGDAKRISVGEFHACIVDGAHRLWCWTGRLDRTIAHYASRFTIQPALISELRDVESVALGNRETCVIQIGGAVRCIENDTSLDVGAVARVPVLVGGRDTPKVAEITEGKRWRCLRFEDRTTRCHVQRPGSSPPTLDLGSGIARVALSDDHGCVVYADGRLACWGQNAAGELGDGTTTNRERPVLVASIPRVASVAVGFRHTCARTEDGELFCWGDDAFGQLGNADRKLGDGGRGSSTPERVLDQVEEIALGQFHSCALMRDRTVRCWGANDEGQLGDGTLVSRARPTAVPNVAGALSVVTHGARSCAVLTDGTARCWGRFQHCPLQGEHKQHCLLSSAITAEPTPRAPSAKVAGVVEIGLGDAHACIRDTMGHVACWGDNSRGQLGVHLPTHPRVQHGGGGSVDVSEVEEPWSEELHEVTW